MTEFQPGDQVFGLAEHTLASHAIARAALLAHNPGIPSNNAAALPVAYLTAAWSLRHLARVEANETVLIHSATGGVGLAAIEVAQRAGARIIATAGSDNKRALLRNMGIVHVFDSRTPDFEDGVRQATQGRGVDVVLNALVGDLAEASIRCLAPFGRFVEMGKRELQGTGTIALKHLAAGISYYVVDLDRLAKEREASLGAYWRQLVQELAAGKLAWLPTTDYDLATSARALGEMVQSRHTGKLVLTKAAGPVPLSRKSHAPKIKADRTYLITGGTGAVGMLLAQWIVGQGGRHLVLTARTGPSSLVSRRMQEWTGAGCNVRFYVSDVSDAGSLNRLLSGMEQSMPSMAGIVHAAGTLADTTIANMDAAAVEEVFRAKVGGALNLHALTLDASLDFFIMVSSVAGVLGAAGQANYAAANASLGALAEARRMQQLPAVAVALGPIAGQGLAAQAAETHSATSIEGLLPLDPNKIAALLFEAAGLDTAHPLVMHMEGDKHVRDKGSTAAARSRILSISSHRERIRALEDLLTTHAARLLRCDPESIDAGQPFKTLGFDSLIAMQLRNRLNDELGVRLATTTFWKYPSPRLYAAYLADLLGAGSS